MTPSLDGRSQSIPLQRGWTQAGVEEWGHSSQSIQHSHPVFSSLLNSLDDKNRDPPPHLQIHFSISICGCSRCFKLKVFQLSKSSISPLPPSPHFFLNFSPQNTSSLTGKNKKQNKTKNPNDDPKHRQPCPVLHEDHSFGDIPIHSDMQNTFKVTVLELLKLSLS